MDMLELECPNCKELLELDIGFAGGVCRCSNCSVLMTVPENPASERAEKLIRPERPEGTSGEYGDQEALDPAEALADASAVDTGTYTTASGKSYQIDADTYIPTARKIKRPAVRATVVLVFVLVMAAIVSVCASALMILLHGAPEASWQPGSEKILADYDPSMNPFEIEMPNIVGLPIGKKSVVVVDTSSDGRVWLGVVKDMIQDGTDHQLTGMEFQLVISSEGSASVFPPQPQPMIEIDRAGLRDFLAGFIAMGQPDLPKAIDVAMTSNPTQVILITGRQLDRGAIESITKVLELTPGTQFDMLLIDANVTPAVQDLVRRYNGRCEKVSAQMLRQWLNEIL